MDRFTFTVEHPNAFFTHSGDLVVVKAIMLQSNLGKDQMVQVGD